MTFKDILNLYVKGIHPTVKFTKEIEDLDTQFEKDMMAKIVKIVELNVGLSNDHEYEIYLDESMFKKYNLNLETADCLNKKDGTYTSKWSESIGRKDIVTMNIFDYEELCNFELFEDAYQELIDEYLSSGSELSYIDWLQEVVLSLRI